MECAKVEKAPFGSNRNGDFLPNQSAEVRCGYTRRTMNAPSGMRDVAAMAASTFGAHDLEI